MENTAAAPVPAGNSPPVATATEPAAKAAPVAQASLLGTPPAEPAKEADKAKEATTPAKPPDAKAPAIEIKFPEGVTPDPKILGAFTALAADAGLDSAKAQKFADFYSGMLAEQENTAIEMHNKQLDDYAAAARADKEIGGVDFDKNLAIAQKTLMRFSPDAAKALRDSPLGNHPAILKLLVKVGKAAGEDSVAGVTGDQGSTSSPEAQLRAKYPNSPKMFK